MSIVSQVSWSAELLAYDFGPTHPMSPLRLDMTMRLLRELGVVTGPMVRLVGSGVAGRDLLEIVHEPAYVDAVIDASRGGVVDEVRGLGTDDTPGFALMHEAAARMTQATVDAADAVWRGDALHAVNLSGGMHHAMPGAASGFCVYNDAAVAIRRLLDQGASRVMYVDVDAHHGDGVEAVFWDDPRVLTVSIHQSGATLFPGTGFATDVGGPRALGTAVNVALPPRTGSAQWLRALDAVLPEVARAFGPDVIFSQHGCDAHALDVLSDLRVSVAAQRRAAMMIHDLAHELCQGRWVALGGGGYSVIDVVPLVWAHVVAIASHVPLECDQPTPPQWRAFIEVMLDHEPPLTLGDGGESDQFTAWSAGWDPADEVDRAIRATRLAVFPHVGVDTSLDL
ncbi:acetoin utilization protein AcuC [Jonesia denitrificans]|uniref:Acetoin utilization protein AcuC n=1 Tax=Jonesia denitrificans (strain ATCC 14870 / DSM 20603 / BCRC 15368 / CIP 55.134 / JCM 11481 / NBRC 15587 / NCTC 10816 / Prevot 55134) TaxID=471856 RepID=C7R0B2_JONDD|nr:acetoin utilization protein AcuC [Jonesia denitrificans]ACV08171.1 histone deacetylase superfamily [Jonesia denitrificans DSM 20603]ASE08156.1 acetoin utilization protein AcuC [Jonesia denitrificans]QXB42759.1 acetoin utilization protein AcuC [Jonesia denitrificans]SQH20152.1 Acetoin utilization protein AcuC [Jonesia denitrificans]